MCKLVNLDNNFSKRIFLRQSASAHYQLSRMEKFKVSITWRIYKPKFEMQHKFAQKTMLGD